MRSASITTDLAASAFDIWVSRVLWEVRAMSEASIKLIDMAERAFAQRDQLAMAIVDILKANDEFRAGMPDGWEGDPLHDACEAARKLVLSFVAPASAGAPKP